MADLGRTVLEFYGVQSLNPDEWPADKGNTDVSDDEDDKAAKEIKERKAKLKRRQSKYQALERAPTNRSSHVPGAEKGNLVQRDEPDPLGSTDSVVMTLKRSGVPVQDDPKLREIQLSCRREEQQANVCHREPLSPLVDDFLSGTLPFTDAHECRHTVLAPWPRYSLPVD